MRSMTDVLSHFLLDVTARNPEGRIVRACIELQTGLTFQDAHSEAQANGMTGMCTSDLNVHFARRQLAALGFKHETRNVAK